MTPERWQAIDRVWQRVLALPDGERAAAVVELTAGDEALRREIESLLAHLARASAAGFGRAPLAEVPSRRGELLGPYTIQGLLGVGGMGEVYRAHDATLERDVAIKMLPEPWLHDPERRARFEREARLLASLNHPGIGAIYGVHEVAPQAGSGRPGTRVLVLELVEGETLAERIARHTGPTAPPRGLPIDDVVLIAGQLTDALEAAHERGIVHRDLKPANIKITPHGRVKVLDFGLARAVSDDGNGAGAAAGGAADVSRTSAGLLMGTAAYMSPEQARGRPVDRRTDIWAFGCVLYEMLTGRPAFGAAGVAGTLANVIGAEPDWRALPSDTPASLHLCLRRCLEKDAARRVRDIADVRLVIEGAFESPAGTARGRRAGVLERGVAYAGWAIAATMAAAAVVVIPWRGPAAISSEPAAALRAAPPPVLLEPRAGGGGGSATAATIQEAIDLVASGGTVRLLPGTYEEALRITKGLTLQGDGDRSGPAIIAPPDASATAIEIATTEPVVLRNLTIQVPGTAGILAAGGVHLTIERSTIVARDPPAARTGLVTVSNDRTTTGVRARVVVLNNSLDGTVAAVARHEGRPSNHAVSIAGDVDAIIERNIIRRAGAACLLVMTRDDLGGETNADIVNNDIDECHPAGRVAAILVGSPPIERLSPERLVTASGLVNIAFNDIRNSAGDCLNSAIAFDVFGGSIERNRIVDFVKPCAGMTPRNRPGAIWLGLRVAGLQMPAVVPSVRFNDLRGNARAGLHIGDNQTIAIDATCNYWGSERGPSGIGPGDGDAIIVQPGAPPPVFVPFATVPVGRLPEPRC